MPEDRRSAKSSRSSDRRSTSSSRKGIFPPIYNAIRIVDNGEFGKVPIDVVAEVANHIGENQVRCIAMKPTDGMVRGMKAIDTGAPITVPVGRETLGRILNVLGEPVDNKGPVNSEDALVDPSRAAAVRRAVDRTSRCSRPASRSSTCSSRTPRAARPACSAAPASARPFSSWS